MEMNPASREIEPRPIVFPAPFQARQLCSVEGISETARTQGGGFSSITSGIITHAPAAAMAGISSPVNGVDFGMFAHRGQIEALTQPRSLQPGSSPVLGSVAHDDHDGCIDSRLGSSVRGNASFGTVAGISEPVAHKPPGAGSSLLSSKGFSATAGTATCTDSHRQHVCGFVYKSSRRVEIAPRVGGIKWMSGQTEIQMRWLQRSYLGFVTG